MRTFLILLLATSVFSMAMPTEKSAVLVGPVSVDGHMGFQVGYSKEFSPGLWATGFGQFGETVEASGELVKLFKITEKLYVGPLGGGGVDWSDRTGTGGVPIEAYLYGTVGAASTYGISNQLGLWGFWKTRTEFKPKFGIGFYLQTRLR